MNKVVVQLVTWTIGFLVSVLLLSGITWAAVVADSIRDRAQDHELATTTASVSVISEPAVTSAITPVAVEVPEAVPPVRPAVSDRITAENVFLLVNYEREKAGLPKLIGNSMLASAAAAKVKDMQDSNYFAHEPEGHPGYTDFIRASGYDYVSAGENLARDYESLEDLMDAWMASEGHRANILRTSYTEIGIAVSADGEFVVQMFGRPK